MKQVNILKGVVVLGGLMVSAQRELLGCYKTTNGLTLKENWMWQSSGRCGDTTCSKFSAAAFSMIGKDCYCGDEIPPDGDKVDIEKCDTPCPGYPTEFCGGGKNFTTLYSSGLIVDIPKAKSSSGGSSDETSSEVSTPSATTSANPSLITLPGQTVVVTASSKPVTDEPAPKSKPNTAGIAAGVVVGVVVIAGIAGGLFLFMRNRKRRAIEEEHRRNAAVNSFVAGGKPPSSSGGASSFLDTRLDPVMAQRRMSDGSIADNQDYSRRILKVTNA